MHVAMMILLVLGSLAAGTKAQDSRPESPPPGFKELEAAFQKDMKAWREKQRASMEEARRKAEEARARGEKPPAMPAMSMTPPRELWQRHLRAFQQAAAALAGKDEAIPYLDWLLLPGVFGEDPDITAWVLERLEKDHLESPALTRITGTLATVASKIGREKAMGLLQAIEKRNPSPNVKAAAILARVRDALKHAETDSSAYLEARKEALRARELATDQALRNRIQGIIDGREKIVKGKIAPDIEGVDLDGVAFKLSDYKGKIILLDFWGDW